MSRLKGIRFQTLTGEETEHDSDLEGLPEEPLGLLCDWLLRARERGVREPGSFTLATANADGRVSSRTVLMLDCNEDGPIFGTHLASRKTSDLDKNAHAAATFYWRETMQQINVAGTVRQLDDAQSDRWFVSRSKSAKAVAYISTPGAPLVDESSAVQPP